jgi:hypothetical protein
VRGSHRREIPHRSVSVTGRGGAAGGRLIRGPLSGERWSVHGDEGARLTSRSSCRQTARDQQKESGCILVSAQ